MPSNTPADHDSTANGAGPVNRQAAGDGDNEASRTAGGRASTSGGRPGLGIPQFSSQGATYYDGRVRNSIPTKLQGVASGKNGNFSVMHMELSMSDPSERIAVARRTSEGTEAASKRFNVAGYRPLRRIKETPSVHERGHHTLASRGSTQARALSKRAALNPHDTKAEQARLLTLLRSLNPITVVDQLCTGLAFFGGIPGALPPADGVFPESAAANGSGSLFVGWLAEIFPRTTGVTNIGPQPPLASVEEERPSDDASPVVTTTESPTGFASVVETVTAVVPAAADAAEIAEAAEVAEAAAEAGPAPAATVNPPAPGKRGRGRPKGSKSSKVRTDKGTKRKSRPSATDVTLPGPGLIDGHELSGGRDDAEGTASNTATNDLHSHQPPGRQTLTESAASGETSGPKKRGRPKGSKNRLKNKPDSARQEAVDEPGSATATTSVARNNTAISSADAENFPGTTNSNVPDDTNPSHGARNAMNVTSNLSPSPSRASHGSKRRRISQGPASQGYAQHGGDVSNSSESPTLNNRQAASQQASATSSFHLHHQVSSSMSERSAPLHNSQTGNLHLSPSSQQLRTGSNSSVNQQAMARRQILSNRRSQPANTTPQRGYYPNTQHIINTPDDQMTPPGQPGKALQRTCQPIPHKCVRTKIRLNDDPTRTTPGKGG